MTGVTGASVGFVYRGAFEARLATVRSDIRSNSEPLASDHLRNGRR